MTSFNFELNMTLNMFLISCMRFKSPNYLRKKNNLGWKLCFAQTAQRTWSGIRRNSRGKNLFKLYKEGRKYVLFIWTLIIKLSREFSHSIAGITSAKLRGFAINLHKQQTSFSCHTFLMLALHRSFHDSDDTFLQVLDVSSQSPRLPTWRKMWFPGAYHFSLGRQEGESKRSVSAMRTHFAILGV